MFFRENPVLQRELLVNLRTPRAFLLLGCYVGLLGLIVYLAWPDDTQLHLAGPRRDTAKSQRMINMFFLGQFVLASLMAPSFAAGSITGEKERKTYEMLLASPLRPSAVVIGKLFASLCHLGLLIIASLPIVTLCIPLGGVSAAEVLAAYVGLMVSVATFGMISLACSSYFGRTAASLVVSYLLILPLSMLGVLLWNGLASEGVLRLWLTAAVLPAGALVVCGILITASSRRLLRPPDVGSEGKEVVDVEEENRQAVGMVIQSDQWPDKLFAPAKRTKLMADGANPVFDKEMRSELFSQGTLMLRLVIQVSMFLAIPLMAVCLFMKPEYAAVYVGYVLLFNMLVGPVFSADRVTGERERQTLELLLTTLITPWQILWGKLVSGLRVSTVLTMFLVWPLLLASLMVDDFWANWPTLLGFFSLILTTCLTTANLALFCSVIFRRTSQSLMATYLVALFLFMAPLAATFYAVEYFPDTPAAQVVEASRIASPIAAAFDLPLNTSNMEAGAGYTPNIAVFWGHLLFVGTLNVSALLMTIWLFHTRWRVAD